MTDADDQQGAPLVALMSYRVWKEKYGGDPTWSAPAIRSTGIPSP
jgi:hypothetical protein